MTKTDRSQQPLEEWKASLISFSFFFLVLELINVESVLDFQFFFVLLAF